MTPFAYPGQNPSCVNHRQHRTASQSSPSENKAVPHLYSKDVKLRTAKPEICNNDNDNARKDERYPAQPSFSGHTVYRLSSLFFSFFSNSQLVKRSLSEEKEIQREENRGLEDRRPEDVGYIYKYSEYISHRPHFFCPRLHLSLMAPSAPSPEYPTASHPPTTRSKH